MISSQRKQNWESNCEGTVERKWRVGGSLPPLPSLTIWERTSFSSQRHLEKRGVRCWVFPRAIHERSVQFEIPFLFLFPLLRVLIMRWEEEQSQLRHFRI